MAPPRYTNITRERVPNELKSNLIEVECDEPTQEENDEDQQLLQVENLAAIASGDC